MLCFIAFGSLIHLRLSPQSFKLYNFLFITGFPLFFLSLLIIARISTKRIHKLTPILEFSKPEGNLSNNSLEIRFHFDNKADVLVLDGLITIKCDGRTIVPSAKFNVSSMVKGLNVATQNFPMSDLLSENNTIDSFEILVIITHFELKSGSKNLSILSVFLAFF